MRIEHIDDVLPHIAGRDEFVVARKDGYTVIDYIFQVPDSFAHPMRRECRGLKFNAAGKLICRPLHKFRNFGEDDEHQVHRFDLSHPHTLTVKLDGSMIAPMLLNNELVFTTRMGRTEVAIAAEALLTPSLTAALREALLSGVTPVFEWTGPKNRIILLYETPQLTLLAVRRMLDGAYWSHAEVEAIAAQWGIAPVPTLRGNWASLVALAEYTRDLKDAEGFVLRFDDGRWVKIKAFDYVTKHRAKDSITLEKNALALVLTNGLDDVLPLLDEPDRVAVERYARDVRVGISDTAEVIRVIVTTGAGLTQKEFAVDHLPVMLSAGRFDPLLRPLAFQVRKGVSPTEAITAMILDHVGSRTQVDEVRGLFKATWEEA